MTTISNVSQIDSLYYTLEKDGSLIVQDETVNNYSNIVKKDSEYKNTFTVSGIGSTTFTFFLNKNPKNYHTQNLNAMFWNIQRLLKT